MVQIQKILHFFLKVFLVFKVVSAVVVLYSLLKRELLERTYCVKTHQCAHIFLVEIGSLAFHFQVYNGLSEVLWQVDKPLAASVLEKR